MHPVTLVLFSTVPLFIVYDLSVKNRDVMQDNDRGTSGHIGYSDNHNSFQHHSDITNGGNIDVLAGDSGSHWTVKANGRVGILTDKALLQSYFQAGGSI